MAEPENYDDFGAMILKFQSSLTAMNKMNQQVHDLYDLLMRVNDTMNDTEFYMENLFKQQVPSLDKAIASLSKAEKKFDNFNYKAQRKTAGAKQGTASVVQPSDTVFQDEESHESEPWQQELQLIKEPIKERKLDNNDKKESRYDEVRQIGERLQALTEAFHEFQKKTKAREDALQNENATLKDRIKQVEDMMV